MVYAMGLNLWGQLGLDPTKIDFVSDLKPLSIKCLDDDEAVDQYTIRQVECGYHHTLLLVDCLLWRAADEEEGLAEREYNA